mmetsp:Transcript_1448/g.4256  ORF Transcript_1448/g.4256 Transcript_1448/m.4256 type:complete len:282 (-) Transcript_1448:458-1303(-)
MGTSCQRRRTIRGWGSNASTVRAPCAMPAPTQRPCTCCCHALDASPGTRCRPSEPPVRTIRCHPMGVAWARAPCSACPRTWLCCPRSTCRGSSARRASEKSPPTAPLSGRRSEEVGRRRRSPIPLPWARPRTAPPTPRLAATRRRRKRPRRRSSCASPTRPSWRPLGGSCCRARPRHQPWIPCHTNVGLRRWARRRPRPRAKHLASRACGCAPEHGAVRRTAILLAKHCPTSSPMPATTRGRTTAERTSRRHSAKTLRRTSPARARARPKVSPEETARRCR